MKRRTMFVAGLCVAMMFMCGQVSYLMAGGAQVYEDIYGSNEWSSTVRIYGTGTLSVYATTALAGTVVTLQCRPDGADYFIDVDEVTSTGEYVFTDTADYLYRAGVATNEWVGGTPISIYLKSGGESS